MLFTFTRTFHASRTVLHLRRHASTSLLSPNHSIYVSSSTNPYFNLTFEDWLFRHKSPEKPMLLLYRDDPCVVVGRNQNPWKEVNLRAAHEAGIPFIRRFSGGGTVYHDLGNTNFSIHLPRATFDRHATAQVVLRAVRSLGVDATVNDRNDICVGKDKIRLILSVTRAVLRSADGRLDIYVSGSAYKIVKDRAYHHGTMLISTRLDTLGELLRSGKDTMETRGIASVRSPVCNLQQHGAQVSHEEFVNAVVNAFREEYGVVEKVHAVDDTGGAQNIEYIRKGMAELKTWDWAFGQTPEFTYKIENTFPWGTVKAEFLSKHGVILSCVLYPPEGAEESVKSGLALMSMVLEGQRYGAADDRPRSLARDSEDLWAVWDWLRKAMDS
ncbi:Lipoyltransferase and lipoate-protein ligase [Epithele typhae]|uniref:Lipoyltransferase and lipoate-protein ligase n=1 Tax=Epithele typhae TaxID=378194 RepID=UPI0020081A82|nr:Lipoyltransferase and lipoate-protein ligase [Epithele typhae]KAH9943166.1 Lipoyltransferase and lipoate-protein ligase [Epithele typhae]